MQKYPKNQSGVVILYALLIIALITAIGIGVSIVIVKELRLTQNTHFATMAYYAAESGVEKALHTVKIFRQDPTKELDSNNQDDTNAAIPVIRKYAPSDFVNDAGYNDSQTKAEEEKVETKLGKDQFTQVDLYDTKDPAGNPGIESLMISWSDGDETNTYIPWLEISYVEWSPGSLDIPNFFDPNAPPIAFREIHSVSESPLPLNFPVGTTAYRVRIKALYDEASNLIVTAYDCDDPIGNPLICNDNNKKPIPARVLIKSVGKMGDFEQAITALVPWNTPLFGLYDYVLYSEGQIEKKIIVGKPIYTSGAIQVEEAIKLSPLPSFCENCSNKDNACSVPLATCAECGWSAQNCICHARCDIETDGTGTCKLDNNSTIWQLPIPSSVAASDKYYLNIRAKYPIGYNAADKFYVIINDNIDDCISIPDQDDGYVSCSIDSPNFEIYPQHCFNGRLDEDETSTDTGGSCPATPMINNKIQFEHPTTSPSTFEIDWYQLSTYKLFDDCKNVVESCPNRPTFPEAGNGLCEACETRFPGDQDGCSAAQCRIPRCSDGICDNDTFKPDGSQHTGFCDGEKQRCCGGVCKNLDCVNNSHCVDTNTCTNDSCNYDGICTASCTNDLKCDGSTCAIGSPDYCNTVACNHCGDGTCNCGEDSTSCLADCQPSLPQPNYEYLRYVAIDENNNDLTSLHPTGLAGKSQRVTPVWQGQSYGANYTYRAVHAADATHVWAVGVDNVPNAKISYTANGGTTWAAQTPPSNERLNGVWSYYDGSGYQYWAVGNGGKIHHCTAGCDTATPTFVSGIFAGGSNINGIFGLNKNMIWAVATSGVILFSSDGTSWSQVGNIGTNLNGVWAKDVNNVWVVGDSGTIRYCSSGCGGSPTWNPQTSNSTYILLSISGTDTSHIWIAAKCTGVGCSSAATDTILYSNNAGSTWTKPGAPDTGDLYGVSAYVEPTSNLNKAILVGLGGNVFYCENSTCSAHTSSTIFLTGSTKVNRAVYAYNWQNIWVVGDYGGTAGQPGVILYGNAPGRGIVTVGNSSDQYWLSGLYSSFATNTGINTANLNITRKPGAGKSVIITVSVGYCNDAGGDGTLCNQPADFNIWRTSVPITVSGSGTQFLPFDIGGSGTFSCTNCRFWTRIWNSTATTNTFDMAVAGRDAAFTTNTQRNSYVDVP